MTTEITKTSIELIKVMKSVHLRVSITKSKFNASILFLSLLLTTRLCECVCAFREDFVQRRKPSEFTVRVYAYEP